MGSEFWDLIRGPQVGFQVWAHIWGQYAALFELVIYIIWIGLGPGPVVAVVVDCWLVVCWLFFFFFLHKVARKTVVLHKIARNKLNGLVSSCHQDLSEMLDASYEAVNADQAMAKVPEGFQS